MPSSFYALLFWLYWVIAAFFGLLLTAMFIRESDRDTKATAAMLLVPVILRVLLIK